MRKISLTLTVPPEYEDEGICDDLVFTDLLTALDQSWREYVSLDTDADKVE